MCRKTCMICVRANSGVVFESPKDCVCVKIRIDASCAVGTDVLEATEGSQNESQFPRW